jgi:molybdopterin/thiamine biosynthesis adenylyltransferase
MGEYKARFKDAPWFNEKPDILIAGLGGIGSNAAYCLTKTINGSFILVDMDRVDPINIGSQFFMENNIGKSKVNATSLNINSFLGEQSPKIMEAVNFIKEDTIIPTKFTIYISAFDNMKARKDLFNLWKKNPNRELLIDGRLRANYYQVFVVTPEREEEYEKTLFDNSEADDGVCTFKQTAYFGMLIGARITHMVVNYLSNKAFGEEINSLPFMVEEAGDAVWINIKEFETEKTTTDEIISK